MKILHTSDWHVGKAIRGRSRADEHEAVLDEIVGIAEAEAVDLVLVAGDLFDSAAPPPDAERTVYRTLLALTAGGTRPVVVIAGNHDNARRLAAVAPLLALGGVHLASMLTGPDDGGVIELEAGGQQTKVAVVPFPSQRYIVTATDLMALDADQHGGRYAERVRQAVEALTQGFGDDTVNLLVAHLMVVGGKAGGGERTAHLFDDYSVPTTAFPSTTHYVALGHLHRQQSMPGPCPAWYCGSPLPLDFGETTDEKAVLVVEAAPGQPAEVRSVPLTGGRRLRTLEGSLGALEALAGTTGDDHLRIRVDEPARPGLADDVRALFPDAVEVTVVRPEAERRARADRSGKSPSELFDAYLAERDESDAELSALFAALLDQVSSNDEVFSNDEVSS